MQEQDIPDDIGCPTCGAEPTHESVLKHQLSDMGYYHDDVKMQCSECSNSWVLGIPIGDFDGGEDLWCDCCEDAYHRVHRIQYKKNKYEDFQKYRVHLKCPNCYYFKIVDRTADSDGIALIGYPDITGNDDGAQNYGYPDEDE